MNVLLDLDGTLTDPREGITRCIQHALRRLGRPVPEQSQLLQCIGPPLHASFVELLDGDDSLAHRAVALYRERFGEVGLYENMPYPGIGKALDTLRDNGARLYLATSKPTVYARRIVAHFGLESRLEEVFGSELDGTRTDKTELLAWIVDELSIDPSTTAMVGDRKHDMVGARANRIYPVGVTWGYGARSELLEAGAAHLLDTPEELAILEAKGWIPLIC
ncbi:MAG: HAD family hydrolase [Xanthomonadales bacterium]|nr:HAD family hydrolase [Xanthomonadales bacterium]